MSKKTYEQKSYFTLFICVIIAVTNIGQSPIFIDNFPTRNIIIPLWLMFAIVCLLKQPILYLGESKSFWILVVQWVVMYLMGGFFISEYSDSELPYTILLSCFVFFVGLMSGRNLYSFAIEKIITAYILSGMFVCVDTFMNYVYKVSLAGRIYSYDSKNSVSQILLTVWILILFFKFRKEIKLWKKCIYIGAFILLSITLIGMKSRATLIAIPVIFGWLVLHGKLDKRLRNTIVIILTLVITILIFNPEYIEILIYDVVLGGRDTHNLDDISSGRVREWQTFLADFSDKPFWGHGRMKREALILTSLLEFGVIGGGLILLIAFWPIYWSVRYFNKNKFYLMFSSIAITYCLNGVFEQLAPFGPGVKCFFLWFMMGILISNKNFGNTNLEEK